MTARGAVLAIAVAGIGGMLGWALLAATRVTSGTYVDRSAHVGVGVRATQIRERNDAAFDDAYETCLAAGFDSLARRLQVVNPTPRSVARAFASGWDPAFRSGPYSGCLAALRTR